MSLSRILQDAEKEEDDEEQEAADHGADAAAEGQPKAGIASNAAAASAAAERERPRVCVVPRMACREIKVALEGMAAPIFHLKEWNVRRRHRSCFMHALHVRLADSDAFTFHPTNTHKHLNRRRR